MEQDSRLRDVRRNDFEGQTHIGETMERTPKKYQAVGLPGTGERKLEPDEKRQMGEALETQLTRSFSRCLGCGVVVLIGLLAVIIANPSGGRNGERTMDFLLAWTIATPIGIFLVISWNRIALSIAMATDSRRGTVHCYRGLVTNVSLIDPAYAELDRLGLTPESLDREWTIEALPKSRRIWRVNGMPVSKTITVSLKPAAMPPPETLSYPNARRVRRELTPAEHREMTRLMWMQVINPLLFALWAVENIIFPLLKTKTTYHCPLPPPVLVMITLMCIIAAVSGVRTSRRLRLDRDSGYISVVLVYNPGLKTVDGVETVRTGERLDRNAGAERGLSYARTKSWVEELAVSGTIWTQDGNPAEWRSKTQVPAPIYSNIGIG